LGKTFILERAVHHEEHEGHEEEHESKERFEGGFADD
jgi:hypothetical protein